MKIASEKCTGCRLCESVCSLFHDKKMDLTFSRIQIDPSSENHYRVRVCLQCEDCPPSEVCPTGAFQWNKATGGVKILEEECNLCGLCIPECPYSSVFEGDGSVLVCDLCDDRPKCVEVCQKQAIQFA